MALEGVCERKEIKARYNELSASFNSVSSGYQECNTVFPTTITTATGTADYDPPSRDVIRPCYYILQILGMWKPRDRKFEFIWSMYRRIVFVIWLACLAAIMCLDFVHYGFVKEKVHVREIMNSACTCLDFLCPFIFTLYYFKYGQFVELVTSVQHASHQWNCKLVRIARWYTIMSVLLWGLCGTFFMVHWFPFFSKPWHYAIYIPVVVYISGWWGTWLTIYGYVCHVHSLQIDTVLEEMKLRERTSVAILRSYFKLQTSLEKTQKDFNVIISLALVYHTLDLIVFSFAYFNSAFGSNYPLWQYIGTVIFDMTSLIFKLYPPAMVAAAAHRVVIQASKRCHLPVTPALTRELPREDMQLYQYMVSYEADMGLKILGIRITVELSMKMLITIVTAAVSFVAFVIPRL